MNWLKKTLLGLAQVARDEEARKAPLPAPFRPEMPAERLARMRSLRSQPYFTVDGQPHVRVLYGDEKSFGFEDQGKLCKGCGARPGDLHVPSCGREQCPACGGTAFLCECKYGNG